MLGGIFQHYLATFRTRFYISLIFFPFVLMGSWGSFLSAQAQQPQPQQQQTPGRFPPLPQQALPPAQPQPPRPAPPTRAARPGGEMVSLNFNRADLVEVIHVLAQHLKLNYTIDPDVKGTVTIFSAQPLSAEDLMPIFNQVLRMNDAVAVKTGNLYRIAPIKIGKGLARPAGEDKEDSYAIQVARLQYFSVAEMKRLLTPFLTPGGEIVDYPRGNFLIIADLRSNIQRLVELVDLMDVNVLAGTRMELYQAKVATAEELAAEMTKIMQNYASSAAQAEGFGAQFVPIPRINQLLIISFSDAAWSYAKRWLDRIDVVAEGPGRRIFVYPVENGKATDLADVLTQALGQASTGRREPSRTLGQLHRAAPSSSGVPGASQPTLGGGMTPTPGTSNFGPQSSPLGAFAAVPALPGAPAPAQPAGAAAPTTGAPGAGARPQEQMRIVADQFTNSLIIYGTAQEFQNIRTILKELDIVPRQVLLDVLITEATLTDSQSLGVEYEILERLNPPIFGQPFGSAGAIRSGIFPPVSTAPGQFGNGVSGIIGSGAAVKAFINALMSDSRLKVLSAPSILAADNRPARIQVGSQEPVATGSVSTPISTGSVIGAATAFASSATIQYQNTGRIVTIIPQVNSKGLVNLQILAEVSQISDKPVTIGTSGSFPSFEIRQAETTAVVQDGETLVIGGIITDQKTRSRTGIPYLMDIPVLGRFFGNTIEKSDRTELIMLITPHVIRNSGEAQDVTKEFKDKLSTVRSEMERINKQKPPEKQP